MTIHGQLRCNPDPSRSGAWARPERDPQPVDSAALWRSTPLCALTPLAQTATEVVGIDLEALADPLEREESAAVGRYEPPSRFRECLPAPRVARKGILPVAVNGVLENGKHEQTFALGASRAARRRVELDRQQDVGQEGSPIHDANGGRERWRLQRTCMRVSSQARALRHVDVRDNHAEVILPAVLGRGLDPVEPFAAVLADEPPVWRWGSLACTRTVTPQSASHANRSRI